MYVSLRSPKGGSPMGWIKNVRSRPNVRLEPAKRPQIVEDVWCYKIGYCTTCASPLHVPHSTATFLLSKLWKTFKRFYWLDTI